MIRIHGLKKRYGEQWAVRGLDLEIGRGSIVGLLGPNGAGKSTTIRILCGFLRPTEGSVFVDGTDVAEDPLAVKRRIGYLPESASLQPSLMVEEYLRQIARLREVPEAALEERLVRTARDCGLLGVMHKDLGELSKGYRQRVGLAHAMVGDPEILVLDEPTAGLDPNQIVEIRELIRTLGREKTVLLSSHILSEVEATCDRVVILSRGELVADGTPADIRRRYSGRRAVVFETASNPDETLRAALGRIDGVSSADWESLPVGARCTLHLAESASAPQGEVVRLLQERGVALVSLREESKTLEDVFRDLTRSTHPA